MRSEKNIRIYHECEGGIEKSAPLMTDWHHEAWRVVTNGDREGWLFLSHFNIKIAPRIDVWSTYVCSFFIFSMGWYGIVR